MTHASRSSRLRSRARRSRGRRAGIGFIALAALVLAIGSRPAWPQDFKPDPNWPCVQRKVPEISPGMVWGGPSIDEVGRSWRDDPEISELARKLASRRTSIDEAKDAVKRFAGNAGAEKERRLTMLFAGILAGINHDRASIISGIHRYAKRQKALADKIEARSGKLAALPVEGAADQSGERDDLEEKQSWDIRIFQEREHALTYVCEQPVVLERRAFALGREIMRYLE